jgi:major membrane immunogen (membrane-anchored lipoprotein)
MTDDRSLDLTPRPEFADRLQAALLREIASPETAGRHRRVQPHAEPQETIVTIAPTARPGRRRFTPYIAAAASIALVIIGVALLSGGGQNDRSPATIPATTIPDGVYRNTITVNDVSKANISTDLDWSGTWTLTVRNGTFQLHCAPAKPDGKDCGSNTTAAVVEAGRMVVLGDRVTFEGDAASVSAASGCHITNDTTDQRACVVLKPYTMRWSFDGRLLRFSVDTPDAATEWNLIIKPLTKVG